MTTDCDFVYVDLYAENREVRIAHEKNKAFNTNCNKRMKEIRGGW